MEKTKQLYPEFVTQKEMCAILGVCKSTGYAIQKRGIISFEYENTPQGRRQQIKVADILAFQKKQTQFNKLKSDFVNALLQYFNKQLYAYPSVLTVSDIMQFTGYAKTTINNWITYGILNALQYKGKKIKSFEYGRGSIITKECFVKFAASPYYRNIRRKSKLHKEQEQEYLQLFMGRQGGAQNV